MKSFRVAAFLEAPLAIRMSRQSQRSLGATSISGTMLRGALANLYLQVRGEADSDFRQLFLDESRCRFGPLDPAGSVLPKTSISCKRTPGFAADGGHGMADQLWMQTGVRLSSETLSLDKLMLWLDCPRCGAATREQHGFWQGDSDHARGQAEQYQSVDMHVGIDRHTGTAARSILYSTAVLEPVGRGSDGEPVADLVGTLEASPEVIDQLQSLLAEEEGLVDVGHARTRGYGQVRLVISDDDDDETGESADSTDAAFRRWDVWSSECITVLTSPPFAVADLNGETDFVFALSFPTGAILVDELLRYAIDPAVEVPWLPPLPGYGSTAAAADGPAGGELACLNAVVRHERIRGWQAAHGLPRPDEWAVARGSVLLYRFRGSEQERRELQHRLLELQRNGIGIRRGEGFGRVLVSDDFHRRFHQQEQTA